MGLAVISASAFCSELAILRNGFSIRHERRKVRGPVTRLYTGAASTSYIDVATDQIERFEKDETPPAPAATAPATMGSASVMPAPASLVNAPKPLKIAQPVSLDQVVKDASGKHQIDPDFINSVIRAESGFNTRAVSPKGAQGLMQLMPGTASNLGVSNALDPNANVDGGTRYLRWLLEKYDYDVPKALAAYNAGPHRVEQYHGVPPYLETRAYVARIIRDFNRRKLAEQKAAALARKKQAKVAAASSAAGRAAPSAGVSSGSR
jgi:soluble lytic murein transglycosylase-like protein